LHAQATRVRKRALGYCVRERAQLLGDLAARCAVNRAPALPTRLGSPHRRFSAPEPVAALVDGPLARAALPRPLLPRPVGHHALPFARERLELFGPFAPFFRAATRSR